MKLIDLNIEGQNHIDTVLPFLKKEAADIICLQEVLDIHVDDIKKATGLEGQFFPSVYVDVENKARIKVGTVAGNLVLCRYPMSIETFYYLGDPKNIPPFSSDIINFDFNRFLMIAEYNVDGEKYRIISTHFTWAPNGSSTPLQAKHLDKVFTKLDTYDEFILCGDFNAPRGGATWKMLADRYKDNVPADVTTTLDQNLHRVKNLQFVVDGLFSTPAYKVAKVKIIDGVSDHKAIVAEINRNSISSTS